MVRVGRRLGIGFAVEEGGVEGCGKGRGDEDKGRMRDCAGKEEVEE